jgi:hypothetical protein
MNTMKVLMLAGFTALSLDLGTAMAQEGGSTSPAAPDYWAPSTIATREAKAARADQNKSDLSGADTPSQQSPYPGAHTSLFTFGE